MKTYLRVPFDEKEEAKSMGAKWDKDKKLWFVEGVKDLDPYKQWEYNENEPPKMRNLAKDVDLTEYVIIYADGASKGNPGLGGWGVLIKNLDGTVVENYGGEKKATNNQMEITAVIKAMEGCQPGADLLIRSDSKYVVQATNEWLTGWKRNDWVSSKKEPVKNKELWLKVDELKATFNNVILEWVEGHSGDEGNDRADALANLGCESVKD